MTSLKWAELSAAILAARHHASLPDNRKCAKRRDVGEAELKPRLSIVTAVLPCKDKSFK